MVNMANMWQKRMLNHGKSDNAEETILAGRLVTPARERHHAAVCRECPAACMTKGAIIVKLNFAFMIRVVSRAMIRARGRLRMAKSRRRPFRILINVCHKQFRLGCVFGEATEAMLAKSEESADCFLFAAWAVGAVGVGEMSATCWG